MAPNSNVLDDTEPHKLFETAGVQEGAFLDKLDDVLALLVQTRFDNAGFRLSYFELFAQGLTNETRSIYYRVDLIYWSVDILTRHSSEGLRLVEHELLFGFVKLLLAQDLADVNFSDCLIDWVDHGRQPHFVAPLTKRGRDLVKLINIREKELVAAGRMSDLTEIPIVDALRPSWIFK